MTTAIAGADHGGADRRRRRRRPGADHAAAGPAATTVVRRRTAKAWAVLDMRSGQFLAGAEQDTPLAVGSLMKLLTAEAAYAAGDPVKVAIAPDGLVHRPEESRIGSHPGPGAVARPARAGDADRQRQRRGPDAGPRHRRRRGAFAELMNQQAAGLGLTNTHAVNVTGLDAGRRVLDGRRHVRLGAYLMGNQTFQLR